MSRRAYLLLAFVFTAQLTIAALFPVMPEEAYHWNFGQHPDWSYYDHPPMIAWSIAVGHALLGDTPLGVRLIPLLFSLGTTLVLARLANRLYGPRAAGWVILLLALEPAVFTIGGWGFPDSPLLLFWSLCLAGVWKATETGNGRWWLAAGAALGLGMLSKYTCALIVPSVFLYLLTCRRADRAAGGGCLRLAVPGPAARRPVALLVVRARRGVLPADGLDAELSPALAAACLSWPDGGDGRCSRPQRRSH
jgi:4-amino-4-deoxy-L-arabinose transferase-like glycosyltransferase